MEYEKKYIDADLIRKEIERLKDEYTDIAIDSGRGWVNANYVIEDLEQLQLQIYSLQQEQPNKESLNENQQGFVNIVTERILKEGPIPTLNGKQKAEFEKEFNRFKQITGMINFPAHMEVYKKIILWFMAWGADNLPNLNKVTDPDELDFQQEQPEVDLEKEIQKYMDEHVYEEGEDEPLINSVARHFYELGKNSR